MVALRSLHACRREQGVVLGGTFATEILRYPYIYRTLEGGVALTPPILDLLLSSCNERSYKTRYRKQICGKRWSVALVITNLIGAVVYVFASSHGWVDPRTPDVVTGEPFIWAMFVFPIWGFFVLLNLTWGAIIVACKQWRTGRVWLLTIPIWAAAAAIDFAHQ